MRAFPDPADYRTHSKKLALRRVDRAFFWGSEGNIPQIAAVTGKAEALECQLLRAGVDESELTTDAGLGRVHLYAGGNPESPKTVGWGGAGSIKFASGGGISCRDYDALAFGGKDAAI